MIKSSKRPNNVSATKYMTYPSKSTSKTNTPGLSKHSPKSTHYTLIKKNKSPKDRIHILKGIHGWQPTKLRLHTINKQKPITQQELSSSLYTLCMTNKETQNHIFQCPQLCAHNFRIKSLQSITNYCHRKHIHTSHQNYHKTTTPLDGRLIPKQNIYHPNFPRFQYP